MSIVKLNNPKTSNYHNIKKFILSPVFPWTYCAESTPNTNNQLDGYKWSSRRHLKEDVKIHNTRMYTHTFLLRSGPDILYATPESSYIKDILPIYHDIFNANYEVMKDFGMMCRCNVNAVEPPYDHQYIDSITQPHLDHEFPHKNMLIYLTDAGGSTFVEGEEFAPEEDDVIVFEGMHWHKLPKEERRVVLVMTYI